MHASNTKHTKTFQFGKYKLHFVLFSVLRFLSSLNRTHRGLTASGESECATKITAVVDSLSLLNIQGKSIYISPIQYAITWKPESTAALRVSFCRTCSIVTQRGSSGNPTTCVHLIVPLGNWSEWLEVAETDRFSLRFSSFIRFIGGSMASCKTPARFARSSLSSSICALFRPDNPTDFATGPPVSLFSVILTSCDCVSSSSEAVSDKITSSFEVPREVSFSSTSPFLSWPWSLSLCLLQFS